MFIHYIIHFIRNRNMISFCSLISVCQGTCRLYRERKCRWLTGRYISHCFMFISHWHWSGFSAIELASQKECIISHSHFHFLMWDFLIISNVRYISKHSHSPPKGIELAFHLFMWDFEIFISPTLKWLPIWMNGNYVDKNNSSIQIFLCVFDRFGQVS